MWRRLYFLYMGTSRFGGTQRNIRYYQLEPLADKPFKFLDVQKLFSIACEDRNPEEHWNMPSILNIEKDIPFHRAFSDAYYTAKILARLDEKVLENYSFDLFHIPAGKEDEVYALFDTYSKYISRGFEDKQAAMSDKTVTSTKCYLCHKNLRKKIRWFSPNGKHYYSVSYCDNHGYMKSKIRIRKAENDKVYVVKTEKFISEEERYHPRKTRAGKTTTQRKASSKSQNHRS